MKSFCGDVLNTLYLILTSVSEILAAVFRMSGLVQYILFSACWAKIKVERERVRAVENTGYGCSPKLDENVTSVAGQCIANGVCMNKGLT